MNQKPLAQCYVMFCSLTHIIKYDFYWIYAMLCRLNVAWQYKYRQSMLKALLLQALHGLAKVVDPFPTLHPNFGTWSSK